MPKTYRMVKGLRPLKPDEKVKLGHFLVHQATLAKAPVKKEIHLEKYVANAWLYSEFWPYEKANGYVQPLHPYHSKKLPLP